MSEKTHTIESDNIASAVREHAERILRAKGTSLRNYMPQSQADILAAVLDCYEAGYRAGAVYATTRAGESHD